MWTQGDLGGVAPGAWVGPGVRVVHGVGDAEMHVFPDPSTGLNPTTVPDQIRYRTEPQRGGA